MNNTRSRNDISPNPDSDPSAGEPSSFLGAIGGWLKQLLGQKQDPTLKEMLEETIEEHEEQCEEPLDPEEKVMLHNVLAFGDIKVSDIMTPRNDISAIPSDIMLPELKSYITEHRHTRVPVYQETLDHVLGFLHVKDLLPMLASDTPFNIKSITRNVLFVPPSMRIIDLLVKMRHAGSHMAIVVDEYGGTDGLVTMEDLFEEIVGDIHDEHDYEEVQQNKITRVGEKIFEVNARMHIDKLEKELGLNLITEEKSEDFDTLGGLIFFQLGRVPAKGETVTHPSGIRFEIFDADPRRIRKVRIHTAR